MTNIDTNEFEYMSKELDEMLFEHKEILCIETKNDKEVVAMAYDSYIELLQQIALHNT